MGEKINYWAFLLSLMCVLLFLIVSFSGPIDYSLLGIHPLYFVLYSTLLCFVLGILGFLGMQDWKGMMRSIATVMITLGLSAFLIVILFFGSLLL